MFSKSSAARGRTALCSHLSFTAPKASGGGGDRNRTDDRLVANQVLYQLSYAPKSIGQVVGLGGLEPLTSRLSGGRSNQLSYKPVDVGAAGLPRTRGDDRQA